MSSLWRKEFAIVIQKNSPESSNSVITFNLKIARFITDKCFHITSLSSYWCPKTMKGRPCMLVSQTSPVWLESFPYVKTSFFPRYICMGADHVSEKAQILLLPKVQ